MQRTDAPNPDALDAKDWRKLVGALSSLAVRRHIPVSRRELRSLAGLAVVKARNYYDPARATCTLRQWLYLQGWRLLLSEIRNELCRRRKWSRNVTFTDLGGARRDPGSGKVAETFPAAPDTLASQLFELLEGLPASDRNMIVLRVRRWTYEQIGVKYGLSREAVRLRMVRVRKVLRRRAVNDE